MSTFNIGDCVCNGIHGYIIADIKERKGSKYMHVAPYHRTFNHYALCNKKGVKITRADGGAEQVTLGRFTFGADGTWHSDDERGQQESWMKTLAHDNLITLIKTGLHPMCSFENGPLALLPLKQQTRRVFFNILFLNNEGALPTRECRVIGLHRFKENMTFAPKQTGRILKKLRHLISKKCLSDNYVVDMYASLEPSRCDHLGFVGYAEFKEQSCFTMPSCPGITTKRVYKLHQNNQRDSAGGTHILRIANISDVYISASVCYN